MVQTVAIVSISFLNAIENLVMNHTYTVRCSDCGSLAIRSHLINVLGANNHSSKSHAIKTECPSCDYLLIICSASGNVIDAHSSTASIIARKQSIRNSDLAICIRTKAMMPWSTTMSA